MKYHLLSTGTHTFWLKPARPTPCMASVSGRTTWRPVIPSGGEGTIFSEKVITVRGAICTGEAGLATQGSSQQFCTPTTTAGIYEIYPVPPRPRAPARACPGPSTELSTCFF